MAEELAQEVATPSDTSWISGGPKPPDTSWTKTPTTPKADTGSVVSIGGVQQAEDKKDFDFSLKFNQDNSLLRAQAQSTGVQALKMIGNGAANIVTGFVEGVGYIPELFDKSHDYSNAVTQAMQSAHNPFGEIFREHPSQTFDLKDPAWWFENIQQLGESAGAFALEGEGLAKIFGGIAEAAGHAMQASKLGMKIGQGAAETLSAATLAYTEGAMSGYRIYDEVYKNNYDKEIRNGTDPGEAHTRAATMAGRAAATTVNTNTVINTLFNMGELTPLFKEPQDAAVDLFKKTLARQEGEGLGDYTRRLSKATAEQFPELHNRHGFTSLTAEMLKEGTEEINTQYAEEKGKRVGKGQVVDGLSDLQNYFNDINNGEGWLQFIMGAVGGAVQTQIIDHLPSRFTTFDKNNEQHPVMGSDGNVVTDPKTGEVKYKKFLVSPKSFNENGTRRYFEQLKDSVNADLTRQQQLHDRLIAATAASNQALVAQTRADLFSISAIDGVSRGLTENWQEEYSQIAKIDNTKDLGETMQPQVDQSTQALQQAAANNDPNLPEMAKAHGELIKQQQSLMGQTDAMQKGFANSKTDNNFKTTAEAAVVDLKHLQELHETIQKKYGHDENPQSAEATEHLFYRQADLYLRKRAIDKEEARLDKEDALESSTLTPAAQFDAEVQKFNQHSAIWNETMKALNDDLDDLKAGKNIKSIVEKYRAKGDNNEEIAKDLSGKLQARIKLFETSIRTAREAMELGTGYKGWKEQNPNGEYDKSFEEYRNSLQANQLRVNDRANLEYLKEQHVVAASELNEVTSTKGLHDLYESLAKDKKKLVNGINERIKSENTTAMLAAQAKSAAAKINTEQKEAMVNKATTELNKFKEQWNVQDAQRVQIEQELKTSHSLTTQIKLRAQLAIAQAKLKYLRSKMDGLQNQIIRLSATAESAANNQNLTDQRNEDTPQPVQAASDAEVDDFDNEYQEPKQDDPLSTEPETFYSADELINIQPDTAPEDSYSNRYLAAKADMPGVAQTLLGKLEGDHKPGTKLSYDEIQRTMRPLLRQGLVSQSDVNEIMVTMPKFMEEKNLAVNPVTTEALSEVPETVRTEDATPEIEYSGQPQLIDNANLFTEEQLNNAYWEQSAKTTDAVKGNSSDLQYITIQQKDKRMIRNVTINGAPQLDTKGNRKTMIPGYLFPGRKVKLVVDTEWNGNIVSDESDELALQLFHDVGEQKQDRFDNYTDQDGKIRTQEFQSHVGYGNMPIKVVDASTGQTLKYFPRVDWVTMTQGLGTFRNVEDNIADENGDRQPGNVLIQQDKNLAIRKRLAELYNQDPKNASLETTITQMTPGRVMYFGDLNENTGKVKYRTQLAEKLLPDTSLQFAVANRSGIMVGKNKQASNLIDLTPDQDQRLRGSEDKPRSSAVALIPMNNGQLKPEPLQTVNLGSRKGEINTIIRAIELYLQHPAGTETPHPLITKIEKATGFDISTPRGLKDFIEQYYTYTSGFSDSRLISEAPINGKKVQQFMLDIPDRVGARDDGKADIKVGTLYSGMQKGIRAELKDGKLSQKFIDALTAGLSTRQKTIAFADGNIKGLNDNRPMKSVSIDKNDRLSIKDHDNYNAYLKSFVSTSVYGLHKIQGTYVYAANGQAMLDASTLLPTAVRSITELSTTPEPGESPATGSPEDIIGEYDNMDNFRKVENITRSTIQADGPEVTVENLSQLRNFIAEGDRNSLTAQDVFEKLQSLGISKIADGYNPFTKC